MATKNTLGLTLVDIADIQGGIQPQLIDVLTSENGSALFRVTPMRPIVGWIDRFVRRDLRPTVSFRALGGSITKSKAGKSQVQEGIFLLSGASEVDKATADRDPRGVAAYRVEEDAAFLEAMGYALSYQSFYGSNKYDNGFDGLLKRLPTTADTYVSAGAGAEYTSIYALKLGPRRFMGTYNLGAKGQLIEMTDYGAQLNKSGDTVTPVYNTVFDAAMGLSLYHPKAIGRLGKIDATHKPTDALMTQLFAAMGWKPDILVTTMTGIGYLEELKMSVLTMRPEDRNYDIQLTNYKGIPVIVDAALSDAENGITV